MKLTADDEEERATPEKAFANIFISFVGAGILGLPYAFRKSGLLLGAGFLASTALISLHCMLLLVQCKRKLEDKGVVTYSQIAQFVYGKKAGICVDVLLIVSQVGFCMGYLVFIGQNAHSIDNLPKWIHIFGVCPILVCLALLRSITALAPFSLFADASNVVGIAVVMYHDLVDGMEHPEKSDYVSSEGLASLPFLFGVCMYCFEGFGLILPIEHSMQDRSKFTGVLISSVATITLLFLLFGLMGYSAYGNHTEDIITLNLPNGLSATVVKVSLCLGLLFTFPIMMVPVYEIIETALEANDTFATLVRPPNRQQVFSWVRCLLVVTTTVLAASVPGFGIFISLVGSLVCALLAFVLPAMLHYQLFKDDMGTMVMLKNAAIVCVGLTGAALGTFDAVNGVLYSDANHYTDITASFNVTVADDGDAGILLDDAPPPMDAATFLTADLDPEPVS